MIRPMPFAGQDVTTSGIYRAAHAGHDELDSDVALIRGQEFPLYQKCEYGVHYTLIYAALSAGEVPEFKSPLKAKKAKRG
jgi:hypothetical protein